MVSSTDLWVFLQVNSSFEKPIKSEVLERKFKVSSGTIRDVVEKLRLEGSPIGSDSRGYYPAWNSKELKPTLEHMEKRAMSLHVMIKALRSIYNDSDQENLF